jgi:hypothetical protein
VAAWEKLPEEAFREILKRGREKLLEARKKRVRPQLDDKVLLGWNALAVSGLCQAYAALSEPRYLELAVKHLDFLETHMSKGPLLFHTWKAGQARIPAFLDDHAAFIAAQIELAQVSGQLHRLDQAADRTIYVLAHFSEEAGPLFYFTPDDQEDILLRKKELYDSATPSGNALMARNLFRLSVLLDRPEWKVRALAMLGALGTACIRFPASFGLWLSLLLEVVHGTREIAIIGPSANSLLGETVRLFIPHRLIMASLESNDAYPLLKGKEASRRTALFFCENYVCHQPVESVNALKALL